MDSTVHIEICLQPSRWIFDPASFFSTAIASVIRQHAFEFALKTKSFYGQTTFREFDNVFLKEHVASISVEGSQLSKESEVCWIWDVWLTIGLRGDACFESLLLHFSPQYGGACRGNRWREQHSHLSTMDSTRGWNAIAFSHLLVDFHGIWESLVYDEDVKANVIPQRNFHLIAASELCEYDFVVFRSVRLRGISYVRSVDSNVISWNRVILLHGWEREVKKVTNRPSGNRKDVFVQSLGPKALYSNVGKVVNHVFNTINISDTHTDSSSK